MTESYKCFCQELSKSEVPGELKSPGTFEALVFSGPGIKDFCLGLKIRISPTLFLEWLCGEKGSLHYYLNRQTTSLKDGNPSSLHNDIIELLKDDIILLSTQPYNTSLATEADQLVLKRKIAAWYYNKMESLRSRLRTVNQHLYVENSRPLIYFDDENDNSMDYYHLLHLISLRYGEDRI